MGLANITFLIFQRITLDFAQIVWKAWFKHKLWCASQEAQIPCSKDLKKLGHSCLKWKNCYLLILFFSNLFYPSGIFISCQLQSLAENNNDVWCVLFAIKIFLSFCHFSLSRHRCVTVAEWPLLLEVYICMHICTGDC